MTTSPPEPVPARLEASALKLVLAAVLGLAGVALTTLGAFNHAGPLIAPGSALILVGGLWLGCELAGRGVRLLPGSHVRSPKDAE